MEHNYNFEALENKFYIRSNKEDINIEFEKKTETEGNLEIEGKLFKVNIEGSSSRVENIRQKINSLTTQPISLKKIYAIILETEEDKLDSDQLFQAFGSIQSIASKTAQWHSFYKANAEKLPTDDKFEGPLVKTSKRRIKELLEKESQLTNKIGQLRIHNITHVKSTGILDQITHLHWKCVNQEAKLNKQLKSLRIELINELKKYQELTPITSIEDLSEKNIILQHILEVAIKAEQFVLIQDILKMGTQFNINHLFAAVSINSPQLIEQILKLNKGIDIDQPISSGKLTLLHLACFLKNRKTVECLVAHGAKVDVQEPACGFTPLHFVIFRGVIDLETIQFVLEHSSNVPTRDKEGSTLLHYAITMERDNEKLLLLLLKYLDPNVKDLNGITPLQSACQIGNDNAKRAVLALIKAGAIVTVQDNQGSTALHEAALASSDRITLDKMKEIIQILISNGASIQHQNNKGQTPLHLAVFRSLGKNIEIISEFIKQGADINAQDKDGNTPLHYAARSGHIEAVRLLLKQGAKKNIRNKDGYLPAGSSGDLIETKNANQIVNLLLE